MSNLATQRLETAPSNSAASAERSGRSAKGTAEIVRQFTPNWFAASMGTGIVAIAIARLPTDQPILRHFAEGIWVLNIVLFLTFAALYLARWIFYPDGARRIFGHSVMSMYFGCIPMALATIINGLIIFGEGRWGHRAIDVAQMLWWFDVGLSVLCAVAIPFMMFTRQHHTVEKMTAVWLLPVVACEVAAVSGGLLAPHLSSGADQVVTLVLSYMLCGLSLPLAAGILVILFLRMAIHKLPHANMAASSWLSLGPIATGALGLLVLGDAAPAILPAAGQAGVGAVAHGVGLILGVMMWGYGFWWMLIATLITIRYLREGLPFNLGWWGYTFPIGVYSVATLKLSEDLGMQVFGVIGGILVAALCGLWVIVATRTVIGAWTRVLFVSPCLEEAS